MADTRGDMVEKVAKAMFAKFWGPAAIPWEKGGKAHQGMMLDLARVAIEAMRTPTEEMVDAYVDAVVMDARGPRPLAEVAPERWAAMLDAILKEGD